MLRKAIKMGQQLRRESGDCLGSRCFVLGGCGIGAEKCGDWMFLWLMLGTIETVGEGWWIRILIKVNDRIIGRGEVSTVAVCSIVNERAASK